MIFDCFNMTQINLFVLLFHLLILLFQTLTMNFAPRLTPSTPLQPRTTPHTHFPMPFSCCALLPAAPTL